MTSDISYSGRRAETSGFNSRKHRKPQNHLIFGPLLISPKIDRLRLRRCRNTVFYSNDRTLIIGSTERSPLLFSNSELGMARFSRATWTPQLARLSYDVLPRFRVSETNNVSQYSKPCKYPPKGSNPDVNENPAGSIRSSLRLESRSHSPTMLYWVGQYQLFTNFISSSTCNAWMITAQSAWDFMFHEFQKIREISTSQPAQPFRWLAVGDARREPIGHH